MEPTQMPVHPNALTVHENGDIIFTDCMCQNITAVNMAGIQTHTFGSVVSDRVDKLENRCAVAVVPSNLPDAGCFVVVDGKSNQILVFGPNYDLRMVFGSGLLKRPRGVVVVPAGVKGAGNIVVVDTGNQRIVEFDMGGSYQSMWKAANFLAEAVAIIPYGVPGAGNIVLVEAKLTLSRRALSVHGLILDRSYLQVDQYLHSFGCRVHLPDRDIRSAVPVQTYVAVDDMGGIIFTDTRMDRICIFDRELEITSYMGLSEDFIPGGVAVVPQGLPDAGSVVVADRHSNRILVFDAEGRPRVLYPPLAPKSSLTDWTEKVDDWTCAVCLQKKHPREVVACCVSDREDTSAQVTPGEDDVPGQHIHAVCDECYSRYRKSKVAQSEIVVCPQCRANALACRTLDHLVYCVKSTISGRNGVSPYMIDLAMKQT
jgi:hypothetical protein